MIESKIKYYRVNRKNNRAYWCPNAGMRAAGFDVVALGEDGPDAIAQANEWNALWQAHLTEKRAALKAQKDVAIKRPQRRKPAFTGHVASPRAGAKTYIYFLQTRTMVKIGLSTAPFIRIGSITASASEPMLKAVIVPGALADERRLHRRFERYRSNGEWFSTTRDLLHTIVRCATAGFVVHDGGTENAHLVESQEARAFESQTARETLHA